MKRNGQTHSVEQSHRNQLIVNVGRVHESYQRKTNHCMSKGSDLPHSHAVDDRSVDQNKDQAPALVEEDEIAGRGAYLIRWHREKRGENEGLRGVEEDEE